MPLDGVTVKCLADELDGRLAGARVDRVFQPERTDIILQLFKDSRSFRLVLSANPASPRIHLTSEIRGNPSDAPMFCMLLRKHLIGARILDVRSPDFERIVRLRFDAVNEMGDRIIKSLLIEMMGKHSNIMLLSQEDRIHDAITHIDASVNRVREILPARPYVPPPGQNKLTPQETLDKLRLDGTVFSSSCVTLPLDKALLGTLQGFSPLLCQEIILTAGLEPSLKTAGLNAGQSEALNRNLIDLLTMIVENRFAPTLFYSQSDPQTPVDFHALHLHAHDIQKPSPGVSEAMDIFYLEKTRQNAFAQKKQHLARLAGARLDHARRKLAVHEEDRQEGAAFEQHKRMGDLLLSNLPSVRPETGSITVADFFSPGLPQILIPLQPNLTASQNAQRYYKLYAKAKAKHTCALRLAAEDMRDITYLESLTQAISAAAETDDLMAVRQEMDQAGIGDKAASRAEQPVRRKPVAGRNQGSSKGRTAKSPLPLQPRRFVSSGGFTILVGRNNLQNDQLTLKTAQKGDIWLHVQRLPGTHVIIQANRQTVPEKTILEAAQIAAWFSRASVTLSSARSDSASLKIAVDYCPASHVRKPAGAKPGMVIYERYQTVIVTPKEPQAPFQFST